MMRNCEVSEPPNIILIISEQHRGDCLGIERHPVLQTPNLDSLAAGGVRLTRAYSSCPTCIAARRNILAGQSPHTHGMVGASAGSATLARWRKALVEELRGRPEGFSDGRQLIPGRPYPAVLPHALPEDETEGRKA